MQSNPNASYPYANGAQMPVRYMVPNGYRQSSPPFANQSFDRFASIAATVRPQNIAQPIRYPPGYRPGMPILPASTMMPTGIVPQPPQQQQRKQSDKLQPPQPYYYNPYATGTPSPRAQAPKKGAKEYKENAFTIAPDGAHSESIKGLVSNNDINDLLKHKGTKVKVSKIYRITKTKHDVQEKDSSDEDLLPPIHQSPQQPIQQPIQRPISSSSSSSSHCSTCSNCSCSECRRRSHIDDDCPECRARRQPYVDDDCPECRAERIREQARRQRRK
jgi:hypothetical protein